MDKPLAPEPHFWDYLIQVGALDQELVSEYRDPTARPWRQLGEILIREGLLSIKQVSSLLGMQADEPAMRIGDLAVREGMLSREQIDDALRIQRQSSPHPLELLAGDERIEQQSLFMGLVGYVRHLEGLVHNLRGECLHSKSGSLA